MRRPVAFCALAGGGGEPCGLGWLIAVSISAAACEQTPPLPVPAPSVPSGPAFEEIGASVGLHFRWQSGHTDRFYLPEIIGGGAALFDMDGDGDLDAYLVQGGSVRGTNERPPNRLYRNVGTPGRPRFEDVTDGSGSGDRGYGMGVACGDYDNDGDVDLYVTNVGPNVLLRNDGTGRFTDVTDRAGVGHRGWGTSAVFLDYDADGDLDLYVCNYLEWSPATEQVCFNDLGNADYCLPQRYDAPAPDVLYRNDGDGTFTDVTEAAGLTAFFGPGLGVVAGDFTGDGRIDIFVANDGMRDQLWANRGDGRFADIAPAAGCGFDREGTPKAGMGVTAADVDDDGDLDLLVVNLGGQTDSFFVNEGGTFTDATVPAGLGTASRGFTRFGTAWVDVDNDGRLDLYQAQGRVMREAELFSRDPYAEPNLLLRGSSGPRFEVVQRGAVLVATSRAAAFGDIDNDGGVDVLVVNRDERVHLLRNVTPRRGHWLSLRVLEARGRDALGATVSLTAGNRRITRDVRAAYSYLASNDPRVHVGLGGLDHVEDVRVRWVDGTTEAFGALGADRIITLRRGQGVEILSTDRAGRTAAAGRSGPAR